MFTEKSLTIGSKGKVEVRTLIERGIYTIVEYRDPKDLKLFEKKFKIYLKSQDGSIKGFLLIPLKNPGRYLAFEDKNPKKDMYVYNSISDLEEPLFE